MHRIIDSPKAVLYCIWGNVYPDPIEYVRSYVLLNGHAARFEYRRFVRFVYIRLNKDLVMAHGVMIDPGAELAAQSSNP